MRLHASDVRALMRMRNSNRSRVADSNIGGEESMDGQKLSSSSIYDRDLRGEGVKIQVMVDARYIHVHVQYCTCRCSVCLCEVCNHSSSLSLSLLSPFIRHLIFV